MAEKRISSRIICKHDVESVWVTKTTFIPYKGELIIYDRDNNYDYERFKIGDGETVVSNLPFMAKDGYTPVRGVDYWTDADIAEIKAEIKNYVDDAILGGAW